MKSKAKQDFSKGVDLNSNGKFEPEELHIDSDDSIENMFKNEQDATQNDVKELFGERTVKARTDLSSRQIKLITKAFYLAKMCGLSKDINPILSDFMTLRISDSRQSRKEYVEGLKSRIDNSILQNQQNIRGQFGK